MMSRTVRRGSFLLTDDGHQMDAKSIHAFLAESYWAKGIPFEIVARSLQNSLCFGLFHLTPSDSSVVLSDPVPPVLDAAASENPDGGSGRQIGFARVITDQATFAYLCDVYVLEEFRNLGLGQFLIDFVMSHPTLSDLRRFMLVTRDAHSLYQRFGFAAPANPGGYMEIVHPNLYLSKDVPNAQ